MATKNTLYIYRRYKVGVKEEDIYRNDGPSVFLYRARVNALGLNHMTWLIAIAVAFTYFKKKFYCKQHNS